ncbi:helix-turn-helix transcriptional regulator [Streptomyces sp. NPDC058442]|uniref:helix-turn-helix transcriptional regulator n=1 Tax=Streptomyces sp. NPDC058442 TaxID=3346503 RepID=UPI003660228F
MSETIVWHRPEYRGRDDQLISLAQVANLAGVTRAAVSNWRRRHDFPAPAMAAGRTVWVVRAEAEHWLATQRRQPSSSPAKPSSSRAARTLAVLEAREEKQAAALAATRKKLRAIRKQLATDN